MNKNEFFMKEALGQAVIAWKRYNEVPVGAIIVHNDYILSVGHNMLLTNLDPTAHAEIIAIRRAARFINNYRLINCDLYVTLEPCVMCVGAIINARIKKLFFGANDPKFGALGSVVNLKNYKWNHSFFYQGGVLSNNSIQLMQEFFRDKR